MSITHKCRIFLKKFTLLVNLVRKVKKLLLPQYVQVGDSRVLIGSDIGMRKNYTSLIYFSSYESIIDEYIKEGDIVFDIGAHVGVTTIMVSERVGMHGEVVSFEPNPTSFHILEQNIKKNKISNVSLYQIAVADKTDAQTLFINKHHTGFDSLNKSNAELLGSQDDISAIDVKTDTLDNFIYSNLKIPKFIKIDVQGAEHALLLGSVRFLEDKEISDLYIYLEFFPRAIENFSKINPVELLFFLENHNLKIINSENFNEMISNGKIPDLRKEQFIRQIIESSSEYTNLLLQKVI